MQGWEQYGISGLVIVGLAWFVVYLMKSHKTERKEMADRMEKMSDKSDRREDETNKVIRDTGGILQGLKTLLENNKK